MDQQLLRELRGEVAEALSAQRREDAANGLPTMTSEDRIITVQAEVVIAGQAMVAVHTCAADCADSDPLAHA